MKFISKFSETRKSVGERQKQPPEMFFKERCS